MRVLVTGGCGFIGANLVPRLLARGAEVRVLDDRSNSAPDPLPDGVELVAGDVRDPDAVARAAAGADAVIHLAAAGNVVESVADPIPNFDINARGTLTVLQGARDAGAGRFVFASTGGALIGDAPPPVDESSVPRPISPYGASKLAGEGYCHAFRGSYGLPTIALRFANVYGPRSAHKRGAVTRFIAGALRGEPLVIYGDGTRLARLPLRRRHLRRDPGRARHAGRRRRRAPRLRAGDADRRARAARARGGRRGRADRVPAGAPRRGRAQRRERGAGRARAGLAARDGARGRPRRDRRVVPRGVLILLPPSEGKTPPARGRPLDLGTLSHPGLGPTRERVLAALVELCGGPPGPALAALGLSPGQAGELGLNAGLMRARTAPAARVYTGVLYERLRLPELPKRARDRVLIASALWGMVRPDDRIPAYRLGIGARLPGLGPLAALWRPALQAALPTAGSSSTCARAATRRPGPRGARRSSGCARSPSAAGAARR